MKELLYAKDSEEFWRIFTEQREKQRQKLARLTFAQKAAIVEKMVQDFPLKTRIVKSRPPSP